MPVRLLRARLRSLTLAAIIHPIQSDYSLKYARPATAQSQSESVPKPMRRSRDEMLLAIAISQIVFTRNYTYHLRLRKW
ncbi:hypothetical protein CGCF413_v006731 [Colletotrichum fructicola]|nr:hypothetical protein CGCF413_v006731 [Colletotrichum fructicola]